MADDYVDYEPVQVAGIASGVAKGMKAYIRDALAHANKAIAKGASPEQVIKETHGVAQKGLHNEAIAVVPHGEVKVPTVKEFKEGTPLGELYQSKNLQAEWPELLENTRVYHQPNYRFDQGATDATGTRIMVNPYIFQEPEKAASVLAHELTHAGAIQQQGYHGLGPLTGISPEYVRQVASQPMLQQLNLAANIRKGNLKLDKMPEVFQNSKEFQTLLALPKSRFDDVVQQAYMTRALGINASRAFQTYHDTYGEQLARYIAKPNYREVRSLMPHQAPSPAWLGPRHAASTRYDRLMSQGDPDPSTIFADDFRRFLDPYLTSRSNP